MERPSCFFKCGKPGLQVFVIEGVPGLQPVCFDCVNKAYDAQGKKPRTMQISHGSIESSAD